MAVLAGFARNCFFISYQSVSTSDKSGLLETHAKSKILLSENHIKAVLTYGTLLHLAEK